MEQTNYHIIFVSAFQLSTFHSPLLHSSHGKIFAKRFFVNTLYIIKPKSASGDLFFALSTLRPTVLTEKCLQKHFSWIKVLIFKPKSTRRDLLSPLSVLRPTVLTEKSLIKDFSWTMFFYVLFGKSEKGVYRPDKERDSRRQGWRRTFIVRFRRTFHFVEKPRFGAFGCRWFT